MEGGDNGLDDCNTNCTYRPGLRVWEGWEGADQNTHRAVGNKKRI